MPSRFKRKAIKRFLTRQIKRDENTHENALIEEYIEQTENERTTLTKLDTEAPTFAAIEQAHEGYSTKRATVLQQSKNFGYNSRARAKRAVQKLVDKQPHVRFVPNAQICTFHSANQAIMLTYDSGADGHYISESDRKQAGLPILRPSTKRVVVANGEESHGNKVTA